MKKFLCINTVNNFKEIIYDPFLAPFAKNNPDIELITITDDTLLSDTRKYGGVTPALIKRMYTYANMGIEMGAECVMCTCTSVNKATAQIAPLLPVPMFNIEEPTAQAAVDCGTKIGVLGTVESSPGAIISVMSDYAAKTGKKVEFITKVVDNAFEILSAGDRDKHDEMVLSAVRELSKEVDCIVFAQISMSLLPDAGVDIPIFKIGNMGLDKARALLA